MGVVGALIAETFVELSADGGISAQAEPAIRGGSALLERVNEQAPNAAAACGGQDVEVSKPSGRRIGEIGIWRDPAEAEEAMKIESTQEELARRVARDSGAAQVSDEPCDESETVSFRFAGQCFDYRNVLRGEGPDGHHGFGEKACGNLTPEFAR